MKQMTILMKQQRLDWQRVQGLELDWQRVQGLELASEGYSQKGIANKH